LFVGCIFLLLEYTRKTLRNNICPVCWTRISTYDRYSNELKVKDTTDTQKYACYFDLHLEIENGGQLRTKLYDKRDEFTFVIVNYPFFLTHIPATPADAVYISQPICYSRGDYMNRAQLLT